MPIRALVLVLALALLSAFVFLNWAAFNTPTSLSLAFGTVQAPLGLIMLFVTGVLAAVFLAYQMYLHATMFAETRRMSRELEAHRKLADETEASRFTQLQRLIEERFGKLEEAIGADREHASAELGRTTSELHTAFDQSANGLAAQIAELDGRLSARAGVRALEGPA
ncbi:MAG: LapA family protein [Betaproteobacteria bacterium]